MGSSTYTFHLRGIFGSGELKEKLSEKAPGTPASTGSRLRLVKEGVEEGSLKMAVFISYIDQDHRQAFQGSGPCRNYSLSN